MEVKGTYKLTYSLDKEPKELILAIELKLCRKNIKHIIKLL